MGSARDNPLTTAAAVGGAVAAGVFLWSRRNQISDQISNLSDQIGEWTQNMSSGTGNGNGSAMDDTAGLTTSGTRSGAGSRSASGTRSTSAKRGRTTGSRARGMSETGGGNASLGAHSGGMGNGGMSSSGNS
jgi:hypothetical protein